MAKLPTKYSIYGGLAGAMEAFDNLPDDKKSEILNFNKNNIDGNKAGALVSGIKSAFDMVNDAIKDADTTAYTDQYDLIANTPFFGDINSLDESYSGLNVDLAPSAKDLGLSTNNKEILQGIQTGAGVSNYNPIGMAIGAGLGAIMGHVKNNNARALAKDMAKAREDALTQRHNNFLAAANKIDSQMDNFYASQYAAEGGVLKTNGANWSSGSDFVVNGGTHEENPNGGVQYGVAPDGMPNYVEEDEVVINLPSQEKGGEPTKYVLSNRIGPQDDELNLLSTITKKPEKYKGKSYAEIYKDIFESNGLKELINRKDIQDYILALNGRIAQAQESSKERKKQDELLEKLRNATPDQQVGILQNMGIDPFGSQDQNEQVEETQEMPEIPEGINTEEQQPSGMEYLNNQQYAFGGHLFDGPSGSSVMTGRRLEDFPDDSQTGLLLRRNAEANANAINEDFSRYLHMISPDPKSLEQVVYEYLTNDEKKKYKTFNEIPRDRVNQILKLFQSTPYKDYDFTNVLAQRAEHGRTNPFYPIGHFRTPYHSGSPIQTIQKQPTIQTNTETDPQNNRPTVAQPAQGSSSSGPLFDWSYPNPNFWSTIQTNTETDPYIGHKRWRFPNEEHTRDESFPFEDENKPIIYASTPKDDVALAMKNLWGSHDDIIREYAKIISEDKRTKDIIHPLQGYGINTSGIELTGFPDGTQYLYSNLPLTSESLDSNNTEEPQTTTPENVQEQTINTNGNATDQTNIDETSTNTISADIDNTGKGNTDIDHTGRKFSKWGELWPLFENNDGNFDAFLPALNGMTVLSDLFGLTNQPDYTNATRIGQAIPRPRMIGYNPTGRYIKPQLINENYAATNVANQGLAGINATRQIAGGNRATAMANIAAQNYSTQKAMSDAISKTQSTNNTAIQNAIDKNNAVDQNNAKNFLDVSKTNALEWENYAKRYTSQKTAEANLREKIDEQVATNRSKNWDNFISNLEAYFENQRNRQIANETYKGYGYQIDKNGRITYSSLYNSLSQEQKEKIREEAEQKAEEIKNEKKDKKD